LDEKIKIDIVNKAESFIIFSLVPCKTASQNHLLGIAAAAGDKYQAGGERMAYG
jgi:hypothetical protein